MDIHSYPKRMIRSAETMLNDIILIFVVICYAAKKAGTQYTMRILPEMLSPFCVIRQDLVLEFYKGIENKKITSEILENASIRFGCIDLRTADKHIKRIKDRLENSQKKIIEHLSYSYSDLPMITPDTGLIASTKLYILALSGCFTKQLGKIIPDGYFSILSIINYLNLRDNFSTTYACKTLSIQDTS
jgi:hypothetical protein